MNIKDHSFKQGKDWVKSSWEQSKGARLFFFFAALLAYSPYLLELISSNLEGIGLFVSILVDILTNLFELGVFYLAYLFVVEKKKDINGLFFAFWPSTLKAIGPLLLLSALLSTGVYFSDRSDFLWGKVICTLISIFIRYAFVLVLFYQQKTWPSIKNSFFGSLLNFWALIVTEFLSLLIILFGLGSTLFILPLLNYVTILAIFGQPQIPLDENAL